MAAVVGLIAGDYFGFVPITSTPFLLLLGWLSLRLAGARWRDVGLAHPRGWLRALAVGVCAGIAMELFATFVTTPFLARLSGAPPDLSEFRSTVGNPRLLLLWIALNWCFFAPAEELAFRGYVMNLFAGILQGTAPAWLISLVATSLLFGWGHGGQGLSGMAQESLSGLLLGVLYLACGRNLTAPIITHGVSNTMAFILIFFGRYPGV